MLLIRKEQMAAFSQYMQDNFVKRMITHLRQIFPNETDKLTDKNLCGIIEYGISNAQKYEISRECDVERYLDLMFLLAFDFDTHSKTRWANQILRKDWDASTKLDVLYARYETSTTPR